MKNNVVIAIAVTAGIASAVLIMVLVMQGQNNMEHAFSQTSYEDSLTHRCSKLQEYFSYDVNLKCDKLVRALTS